MNCPKCGEMMELVTHESINVDRCPGCGGMWFDLFEAEDLIETETGASIWSSSANESEHVGNISVFEGEFYFDTENPDRAFVKVIDKLIKEVTRVFRVTWTRK